MLLSSDVKIQQIYLTVLFSCFAAITFAQSKSDTARINFIKSQYTLINSRLPFYKTVTKNDNRKSQSTNGGRVTAYFDSGELKKIVADYYNDTGKATYEYYYYHSKLIFYYGITYHYKIPLSANPKHIKIDSTYEGRLYFHNGVLVSYVNYPQKAFSQTQLNQVLTETLNEAAHILKLAAGRR